MSRLPELPTFGLLDGPTPLQELPRLSAQLGVRVLLKREDMTGLALGGNKARKLDHLLPPLLAAGVDCLVTGAFFQSNWCTAAAAAARRAGLDTFLVKRTPPGYAPETLQGNHLLHVLLGATIETAGLGEDEPAKQAILERLRREGRRPALVSVGGNGPHGVFAYAVAFREILDQAAARGVRPGHVFVASGSGGTHAGLLLGARLLAPEVRVVGITTGSRTRERATAELRAHMQEADARFGLGACSGSDADILVEPDYAVGYGTVTPAKLEAMELLARLEGVVLDPVYTSTAAAALIGQCRRGLVAPGETVVLVHTGGQAALFAYDAPLAAHLRGQALPWTVPPWHPPGQLPPAS